MSTTIEKEALSVEEFRAKFGLGRTAVYAELAAGRLKARKVGKRTIIPIEAVKAWEASLPLYSAGQVTPGRASI